MLLNVVTYVILAYHFYTERQDDPSSSDMQWKITDVAGPSQLGSKERLQYKKNLLGELEGLNRFISEVV